MSKELNIIFSLKEKEKEDNNVSDDKIYAEVLQNVNDLNETMDYYQEENDMFSSLINIEDFMVYKVEYSTNYTKKELEKIADYYEIPKRRKKKDELIEDIILYESNEENVLSVYNRKRFWGYLKELKEDKYLRQFIIFD